MSALVEVRLQRMERMLFKLTSAEVRADRAEAEAARLRERIAILERETDTTSTVGAPYRRGYHAGYEAGKRRDNPDPDAAWARRRPKAWRERRFA